MNITSATRFRSAWRQRLERQVWRRRMVVLTYLAILSIFVLMPLEQRVRVHPLVGWLVSLVLVVVAIGGVSAEWVWLNNRAFWWSRSSSRKERTWDRLRARGATAQEIGEALMRPDDVDERQRSVLDHSYRYAYGTLAAAMGGALVLLVVAPGLIPTANLLGLLLTFVATLPTAVVAWTEPDPPEDH